MDNRTALSLPDPVQFKRDIQAINQFQQIVHENLLEGQDYGVIPGTVKPTLLKPGAEKIAKLLGLADIYELLDRQENWDKPFFRYLVKCKLVTLAGQTISEGMGECNSMESKYRWRESKRKCPECGVEAIIKGKEEYGGGWLCFKKQGGCGAKWPDGAEVIESQQVGKVENDDIYSLVNTILKMGKKRALVDAALSAGRLSNLFTQDIEDMGETIREKDSPGPGEKPRREVKAEVVNPEKPQEKELNWDEKRGPQEAPATTEQISEMTAIIKEKKMSQEQIDTCCQLSISKVFKKRTDITLAEGEKVIAALKAWNKP